jgi:hypothetical protein
VNEDRPGGFAEGEVGDAACAAEKLAAELCPMFVMAELG